MKLWYEIKAKKTDASVAVISVFEEIGIWGISGKRFADDLKAATKDAKSIELLINSPGGSVFDALLMFNALRATGLPIAAKVMGMAASAASYLAMAGDTLEMPSNTFMMVHNPIGMAYGNAEDMRDFADLLDKVGGQLLNTYVKRTGKPEAELKALFDAESYLTAAECLELGLCDTVTDEMKVAAKYDPDRPGVPDTVKASIVAATAQPDPEDDDTDPEDPPNDDAAEATANAPALAAQVEALAAKVGLGEFAAVFALDAGLTTLELAAAAMQQAREVQAICNVAGKKDEAAGLIRARKSVVEARTHVLAMLAAEADATHTSTVKPSNPPAPANDPKAVSTQSIWDNVNSVNKQPEKAK